MRDSWEVLIWPDLFSQENFKRIFPLKCPSVTPIKLWISHTLWSVQAFLVLYNRHEKLQLRRTGKSFYYSMHISSQIIYCLCNGFIKLKITGNIP